MALTFNNYAIQLQEVPGEISLSFYIADCPHRCEGCSSPWLWLAGNYELSRQTLERAIAKFPYISCVTFMGGDGRHEELIALADMVHKCGKKVCVYSGDDYWDMDLSLVCDYYKVGSWDKNRGPLNCKTTNQTMWRRISRNVFENITALFQTKESEWKPHQEEQLYENH